MKASCIPLIAVYLLQALSGRADGIISGFSSICYGRWPGSGLSPSVMVINPAWCPSAEFTYALQLGLNWTQTVMRSGFPSSYEASTINPFMPRAAAFAASTFGEVTAGIGLYSPSVMRAHWPDDWSGRYIVREFQFQPLVAQPTFGYKLSDNVVAALSALPAMGIMTYSKAINLQSQSGEDGSMMMSGKAIGFGGKAGLMIRTDDFDFGISAMVPPLFTIHGNAEFTVPASLADSFPPTTFIMPVDDASAVGFQLCYKKDDRGLFSAGIDYAFSLADDSARLDFDANSSLLKDEYMYLNRKQEITLWAGLTDLELTPNIGMNIGGFYSTGTAVTEYVSPLFPDSDRAGIQIGFSAPLLESLELNLAINYMETATIAGTSAPHNFEATYKSRTWGLQMGFVWL